MSAPLYQAIKDRVLKDIEEGVWKVGDKIPSEHDFVKQFNVSRMTANRALRELHTEGVLVRVSGAGTFVAPPRTRNEFLALRDISEELKEQGHMHDMYVLSQDVQFANAELAGRFNVDEGTSLAYVCVRHERDGIPVLLEKRWVLASLVPKFMDVDFTQESTYKYLIRSVPLKKVEHKVRAILADETLQKLMKLKQQDACLMLRRRTWSQVNVASCADLIYIGARYELTGIFTPA